MQLHLQNPGQTPRLVANHVGNRVSNTNACPSARRFAHKGLTAVALCAAVLVMSACSTPRPADSDPSTTAESLYRSGKAALNRSDFLTAIDTFETLGARFPFGTYTQQAQLDIAYAYLRQDEYDNAIASVERFIKLYPQSESIDYAYYMRGLAHFSRGGSAFERIFPRDMSKVNQNWLRASFAEFQALVRRFPESEYAPDAIERMEYLREQMASHELQTARFYYERGAMVAVVNRVTYLLERFDGTTRVPDALALLSGAYLALGQEDRSADTLRVLAATDPEHPALDG